MLYFSFLTTENYQDWEIKAYPKGKVDKKTKRFKLETRPFS